MSTKRLDHWLLAHDMAKSRTHAMRLIRDGVVEVNGRVVEKPSKQVELEAVVRVTRKDRYVGRGGKKLEAALRQYEVVVRDKCCLDVGASTGGFTDCLLQHGATDVLAIDVGHNQMSADLASDKRVRYIEGINARALQPSAFGQWFDIIVADVSFISLTLVLPGITAQAQEGCDLIALIKPQFELRSAALNRKGVVRSHELRLQAVDKVIAWFTSAQGWKTQGVMDSPIPGGNGNQEYLIYAKKN
ncbi:MAG: TlyA family RNA methyltransferase [Verrucomicrobiota bacterium]